VDASTGPTEHDATDGAPSDEPVTPRPDPASGPVDWDAAARFAARLAPAGRTAGRDELEELVAELRDVAGRAATHASGTTGLVPADGSAPADVSRVLVVDRAGWARANTQMLATMAGPLVRARTPSAGARLAAAAQVGGVLALLSGKVLGQFDPWTEPDAGRLLLVAPNVWQLERRLQVDPSDFRLWVALHEQTHALQFAAAPWLAGHLRDRAAELLGDVVPDDESGGPRLGELLSAVRAALRNGGGGVLDVLDPDQKAELERVGAVMALLEGHADVAMDDVGPSVVPTVRQIRRAFEARRDEGARSKGLNRVLRRLLGLDAKLAQYRDGAAFVRGVRRRVGQDGLNAVFAAAENLPTPAEVADPPAWVRRVHG